MTTLTPSRLAEIEAAHGKATAGRWLNWWDQKRPKIVARNKGWPDVGICDVLAHETVDARVADGESICLLHNEFPAVAAALREAWAEIERLRAAGDAMAEKLKLRDSSDNEVLDCLGCGASWEHKLGSVAPCNQDCPVAAWNAAKGGNNA